MNLNGQLVYPLAEELLQRKIPLVFLTGYDVPDVPEPLRIVPHIVKPADPAALLRLICRFGDKD
jgi:two-component system, response regulator PdtaR